jgi:glucose-1-phosphate thymidylyltransferase
VGWTKVEGWWKDTGKPDDIFEANRLILDDLAHAIRGEVKGELRGRVSLGDGTTVNEKSVIKGPALIGKDCTISDSYIGPYTSIGNNCEIIKKKGSFMSSIQFKMRVASENSEDKSRQICMCE